MTTETTIDLDNLDAHLRYPFNPALPLELQRGLIAELREARAAIERVRALAYSFAVGADGEERILEALDGAR